VGLQEVRRTAVSPTLIYTFRGIGVELLEANSIKQMPNEVISTGIHRADLADGVCAEPYLTTPQPTILFSVNDGEAPNLFEAGPDTAVPADSITVIRLYPDRPPTSRTKASTANSSIVGTPYAAIIGRFGVVTNHTVRDGPQVRPGDVRGKKQDAVVDLLSDDLAVTDRIETESGVWQVAARPSDSQFGRTADLDTHSPGHAGRTLSLQLR